MIKAISKLLGMNKNKGKQENWKKWMKRKEFVQHLEDVYVEKEDKTKSWTA
jgi:hypothetical protein